MMMTRVGFEELSPRVTNTRRTPSEGSHAPFRLARSHLNTFQECKWDEYVYTCFKFVFINLFSHDDVREWVAVHKWGSWRGAC